jgi:ABC-type multidrug transport system fused ATPase/permease subunit
MRKTVRRARRTYTALAPYGRPHRMQLAAGAGATLALVACRLAFPWPLRGLMEIVFGSGTRGRTVVGLVPASGDPLWWLTGALVAIILLWGVSESIQRLCFTRFSAGLVRDARAAALDRVPAADRKAGDLITAVTGDTARVKSGLKSVLIGTSRNGAFFVGVAVIISLIDPLIGLVFLAGGLATMAVGVLGAWRSSRIVRRSRKREGGFTDQLHHYFHGDAELPSRDTDPQRSPRSRAARVEVVTTFAVHAVLAASTCAILVLAVDAGRNGTMSPGSVFTILAYILMMHNKTVGFGRRIVRGGRMLPSAERLAKLVSQPDDGSTSGEQARDRQRRAPAPQPRPHASPRRGDAARSAQRRV